MDQPDPPDGWQDSLQAMFDRFANDQRTELRAVIAAAFRTLRLYGVHLLAEVALPAGHDFGRDIP